MSSMVSTAYSGYGYPVGISGQMYSSPSYSQYPTITSFPLSPRRNNTIEGEVPQCSDHLDDYHKSIIQANNVPRVWKYTGPPEDLAVKRGLGWIFAQPTIFFLEPGSRRITDLNGVPVLHLLHTFGGFKLFDFEDNVLGKTDGSKTVWCADTPSRKYALRKSFPTYYDFTIERSQKTMPFVSQTQSMYRTNWGALFPPINSASIMDENGDIMATVSNWSGSDVNSKFQVTIKENENAILFLLVACHMADFVVQHCADHTKTAYANREEEYQELLDLNGTLKKWNYVGMHIPVTSTQATQPPASFLDKLVGVGPMGGGPEPPKTEQVKEREYYLSQLAAPSHKPSPPKYDFTNSKYFHPLTPDQARKVIGGPSSF